jgi:hypothetical protein
MRIISIDVGIKNLAFCLFDVVEDVYTIVEWNVVNLSEETETKVCCDKNKGIVCKNEAKFMKNELCYCLKHAKKQEFLLPFLKPNSLKRMKVKDLLELTKKHDVPIESIDCKKAELLEILQQFVLDKCFEPIQTAKAANVDLVTIGRNIKIKLDKLLKECPDKVIIENQISPIANRMKTIQGMIAQYFIMKNTNVYVEFVSSSNKLKEFGKTPSYSDRKKLGVKKCEEIILEDNESWSEFFKNHKKKDDLADSFLQGVWYIQKKG